MRAAGTKSVARKAIGRAGGPVCGAPAAVTTLDRAHLDRQTLNDPAIRRDVLRLFSQQLEAVRLNIAAASPSERYAMAHALNGSARGVGAFALADAAAALETGPREETLIVTLLRLGEETLADIRTLLA